MNKDKLEERICDKIELFAEWLNRDRQRVCTKTNLKPLAKLIARFLDDRL